MTVQLSLLVSETAVTTAVPFLRPVTRPASTETTPSGEALQSTVWSVASGGVMETLRSAELSRGSSRVCWLRATFWTGMMSGSGRGVGGVVSHSFFRAVRSSCALLPV